MGSSSQTTLLFSALSVVVAVGCVGCKGKAAPSANVMDASTDRAGSVGSAAVVASTPDAGAKLLTAVVTKEGLLRAAAAQVSAAIVVAGSKDPDCAKVLDALGASLYVAPPEITPENRAAVAAIGVCQRKTQRWRDLEQTATILGDDDPASFTAALLPRAKIGVGEYVTANTALTALLKQWPKDGEVYATAALASWRLEDWDECGKRADQALAFQRKVSPANTDEVSLEARLARAQAYFFSGKIDDSTRELDALAKLVPEGTLTKLQARNVETKKRRLWVEPDVLQSLFLGVLPTYAKNVAPLGAMGTFKLFNFANHPFKLTLEVNVPGICDPVSKSFTMISQTSTIKLSPTPRADLPIDAGPPREAALTYTLKDSKDGTVYLEGSLPFTVQATTELPLMVTTREGDLRKTRELSAAWITPGAKGLAPLIDAAKKRVPGGDFTGTATTTFAQVQAIWDEMRAREFSFARDPGLQGTSGVVTTHLPAEVTATRGGTYLEGVLLFASLLERIGLDPILVFLPGHALVGWVPSKDDATGDHAAKIVSSPAGDGFFLDATNLRSQPMEAAMLLGAAELVDRTSGTEFNDGRAAAYVVSKLRAAGIVPRVAE